MNYYYYPLCSKEFTFENIFSSESISPARVVELRGFGADFFYTIPLLHHPEMLVLYNMPPQYSIADSNYEIHKFILKIQEEALTAERLIFISEGIVGYTGTIYLNNENIELLFFSEREQIVTCLRSEISLLTKNYKKYKNNFKIINEADCVQFDTSMINQLAADQNDLQQTVTYDRRFNSFKGFCYGLASGIHRSFGHSDIVLKRSLQNITNSFAEFKNRIANENKRTFNNVYQKGELRDSLQFKSKLFNNINNTEQLFKEYVSGETYSEEAFENFVHEQLKKHEFQFDEIELFLKFKKMEDLLLGTNNLSRIKNVYLKTDSQNPALLFELLRECIGSYTGSPKSNSESEKASLERANDSFKKSIYELTRLISIQSARTISNSPIDFSGISYDKQQNEIKIDSAFQNLDKAVHSEFITVLNTILQHTKSSKGEAKKDDILRLVELVARGLNREVDGKNTHLFHYLNGETIQYDPDKVSSVVMKNFVAFVFNPDSLEKLENYLNVKRVDYSWMAYSFWCCYNGFANISRDFVAPFFEGTSAENSIYLDQFIPECFLTGKSTSILKESFPQESTTLRTTNITIDNKESTRLFFENYIAGRFKLSLEQFRVVIKLNDRDAIIDSLKVNYRIPKREAIKIIDQFEDQSRYPSLF